MDLAEDFDACIQPTALPAEEVGVDNPFVNEIIDNGEEL
jgi:hypothetical protein